MMGLFNLLIMALFNLFQNKDDVKEDNTNQKTNHDNAFDFENKMTLIEFARDVRCRNIYFSYSIDGYKDLYQVYLDEYNDKYNAYRQECRENILEEILKD